MKRLQFTWNLTDYRTREVVIQLDFLQKGELSQTTFGKDQLEINILTNSYLISTSLQLVQPAEYQELSLYPISLNFLVVAIQKSVDEGLKYVKGVEGSYFILNIILGGSLQALWGILNSQAILNHLALI